MVIALHRAKRYPDGDGVRRPGRSYQDLPGRRRAAAGALLITLAHPVPPERGIGGGGGAHWWCHLDRLAISPGRPPPPAAPEARAIPSGGTTLGTAATGPLATAAAVLTP